VEKIIRSIQVYLKESGWEIAPNKCQLCIFDKKGTADGEWEITVQGEKVTSVKSIKFLGLHLKFNLDWEDELNAFVRKCENPMKIINYVKHTWWGANPVILTRLCKALMRSRRNMEHFYSIKLRRHNLRSYRKYNTEQYAEFWATGVGPRPMQCRQKPKKSQFLVGSNSWEGTTCPGVIRQATPNGPAAGRSINSS
jgi:hypothetical protein